MNILEVTREYYPSIGGLERFVHDRTRIYAALGHSYHILSTDFTTEKTGGPRIRSGVTRLPHFTPYSIAPGLRSHLTDAYDLISINMIGRYYSDRTILHYRHRRQTVVLTPYFAYHTGRFGAVKKLMERFLFPQLLNSVHMLIVFTEVERRFWEERFGLTGDRIRVIPPYLPALPPLPDVPNGRPFILHLGRSGTNKRTNLLIEAFLRLSPNGIDLKITQRPDDIPEKLRILLRNRDNIQFLGEISEEEKQRLLNACVGLVFPTSWESFGYVAFEAAACGKPLLCSDLPVLRELHDGKGTVFFPNSVEGITSALETFLSLSSEERERMGESNRRNCERFGFERAVGRYRALFEDIRSVHG